MGELGIFILSTPDRSARQLCVDPEFKASRLDALARPAIVEARRWGVLEAPQKAIHLQKKQEVESRLVLDKARFVNMPNCH